jgi:hypothetical protein
VSIKIEDIQLIRIGHNKQILLWDIFEFVGKIAHFLDIQIKVIDELVEKILPDIIDHDLILLVIDND